METNFLPTSVEKAIFRLFEDLASPVSLKATLLLRDGDVDQLSTMKVDPRHYLDAESYWRDATAASILRKCVDLPTSFDRKAVAEEAFLKCERECLSTNSRLYPFLFPEEIQAEDKGVLSYIKRVQKIIGEILGPCPDVVDGRFGPGATYGDRGRFTTIPDKMSSEPTLTTEAWPYHFPWMGTLWAKAARVHSKKVSYVRGNRFTTVDKDCSKDRGIAIEPSINVFYQLAYGKHMRSRLKMSGINLTNGQDIHRRVACEASIRGHLATIDLSNASDTVCRNLVKLLLPARWYRVLEDLRSKRTLFRGNWVLLEKFSSMGNGFTFELETLIFLGLVLGLSNSSQKLEAGQNVFVYGDDIILPTECSKDVYAMLSFFGMTVNKAKSFVDGPFRESCGGDYFMGTDVRPYFLKASPNEPQQLIALANGLRRSSHPSGRWRIVRRSWLSVLDGLPVVIRSLRGPSDLGDLVIHDEESLWSTRTRWRNSIRYVRCYRPAKYRKVPWSVFNPDATLAAAVYGVPWGGGGVIPRNPEVSYKVGWVPRS